MTNVIIPTWHAKETLPQALDSLVAQTKKMFAVTIVQDCDGEDYTDIVEEYRRRGLYVRLLCTPENGGPGLARQYGIDASDMYDVIMFLDADDVLMPTAVEVLTREINRNNADIVASSFLQEHAHDPSTLMDVDMTPCTWTHGKAYRTTYLKNNNIRFLPDLRLNEDAYFNFVAWNSTAKRFGIKEVTYLWRDNNKSLTRSDTFKGFFIKSWEGYLYSQVQGLNKVIELRPEVPVSTIAATILNLYHYFMRAVFYELELNKAVKILFGTINCAKDMIPCREFWEYIAQHVKACDNIDDTLYFFDIKFNDWFYTFVINKEQMENEYFSS